MCRLSNSLEEGDPESLACLRKTVVVSPGSKVALFALLYFIRPLDFSETFPKYGDNRYDYKISTAHSGKTLIHAPGGLYC